MNRFHFAESRELSYVIGVILGDGQIKIELKNYAYRVRLRVKDKEFAEKFAECMQKILKTKKANKIFTELDRTRGYRRRFVASVGSKEFVEFLKSNKEDLSNLAEKYPADFLRGLFDSEGFTSISPNMQFQIGIGMANTNLILLRKVKNILQKEFGIKSHITVSMKKNEEVKIWNKIYHANKNVYCLAIHKYEHIKKFSQLIRFTIYRKQEKLEEAILLKHNRKASKIWKQNYMKIGREWVKKIDSGAFPESSLLL